MQCQSAGIVGKAARVAAEISSFPTGSSKHDHAPAGPCSAEATHLRESERMLIDSGVPAETFEEGSNGSTALSAAAATAPQPEGTGQERRHNDRQNRHKAGAGDTPTVGSSAGVSAAENLTPDVGLPGSSVLSHAARDKPPTSAHHISQNGTDKGVSNSTGPSFKLVTELSVNIDAEEGNEILYEMSQLALLESLLVDSTDEFSFDPGFQPFERTTNLRK